MFNPLIYVYKILTDSIKQSKQTKRGLEDYYRIEHVNEYSQRRKRKKI